MNRHLDPSRAQRAWSTSVSGRRWSTPKIVSRGRVRAVHLAEAPRGGAIANLPRGP